MRCVGAGFFNMIRYFEGCIPAPRGISTIYQSWNMKKNMENLSFSICFLDKAGNRFSLIWYTLCPPKNFTVCILAITTWNLHQIVKVRSVSKSACSQLFKTVLTFYFWPSSGCHTPPEKMWRKLNVPDTITSLKICVTTFFGWGILEKNSFFFIFRGP